VVYSCKYHIVFCPKYRRKVLVDGVDERLKNIIHRDDCKEFFQKEKLFDKRRKGWRLPGFMEMLVMHSER